MHNNLDLRNTSVGIYTPDVVTQAGVEAAIFKCRTLDMLAVEVYADASEVTRSLLERLGFIIGGTATRGTDVLVKYRLTLRRTGEGFVNHELSTGLAPVLEPTNEEKRAISQMNLAERYSDDVINRNVARIEAECRKPVWSEETTKLAEAALRTQHRREGRE